MWLRGLVVAVCLQAVAASALTVAERDSLARAFAPLFTFHPDEIYFPTDLPADLLRAGVVPADTWRLGDGALPITARISAYEAWPFERKLTAAVIHYRVVERDAGLEPGQIRIEYWLYFVANRYRMRGGLIPYRANGDHVHDLEHVFLTLERRPGTAADASQPADFGVRRVWASAHMGAIPNNQYEWRETLAPARVSLLVELGSHALAPDANHDRRFNPDDDATGSKTFVWGIRDHGETWERFSAGYQDERGAETAVRLRPAVGGDDAPSCDGFARCAAYRLWPVTEVPDEDIDPPALTVDTAALALDSAALYGSRGWAHTMFGEVDARQLVTPSAHPEGDNPELMDGRLPRSERGLAVGFTPILSKFTGFVSGRYSVGASRGRLPMATFNATLLYPGRTIGEVDASLSFPVDVIMKVLVGYQARADFATWERERQSPHAGIEFRIGRWRYRLLGRNARSQTSVDFKMYYFLKN